MPHADVHDVKRSRNYAVLAAILGFALVVFFVSIIRMKGG